MSLIACFLILLHCYYVCGQTCSQPLQPDECPCSNRTRNASDQTGLPCFTEDCYWDKGSQTSMVGCTTDCSNPDHYEKKSETHTCELKSCAERIKNEIDPSLPCGPGDCYWDMYSDDPKCIEKGTECTRSKDFGQSSMGSIVMDVLMMIDATGSMAYVLENAKEMVLNLSYSLQEKYPEVTFRFGSVCYRDMVHSTDRHESFDFNTDVVQLREFLSGVEALYGGDEPEDIAGGMEIALNLSWTPGSLKAITLIADNPQINDIVDGIDQEERLLGYLQRLAEMNVMVSVFSLWGGMDTCKHIFEEAFSDVLWSLSWESLVGTIYGDDYANKTYDRIESAIEHGHNHTCLLKAGHSWPKKGFWWWWILLIVGLLLLAAIIALIIALLLWKRKHRKEPEIYVPPDTMPVCPVLVMCDGNTKDNPDDHLLRKRQEELQQEQEIAAEQRERENVAGRMGGQGGRFGPPPGNNAGGGRFGPPPGNNAGGGRFSPGPGNNPYGANRFGPPPGNNAGRYSPGPGVGFNGQY